MLESGVVLMDDLVLDDEDEDGAGAIPNAASVTALRFSMSSLASAVLLSLTGLARNVRDTFFAVAVLTDIVAL